MRFLFNLFIMIFVFKTMSLRILRLLWDYRALMIFNSTTYKHGAIHLTSGIIHINPMSNRDADILTTTLLHEIGHWIDYQELNGNWAGYNSNRTKYEKRAWRNAIKLANKYNLPLDYKDAQQALSTYDQKAKSAFIEKGLKAS